MNEPSGRTALLAGASGLVGSELLKQLMEDGRYSSVIILVRKNLPVSHPKLQQIITHFDKLDEISLPRIDDAFCTLGTTIKKAGSQEAFTRVDLDYVRKFASLSHSRGARRFMVVSSMGANPKSSLFYSRVKGLMEQAVSSMPFDSVFIFRPSLLMGKRNEFRYGEKLAVGFMKVFGFLFAGPLLRYQGVHAETVAKAMIYSAWSADKGINIIQSDRIQKTGK